MEERMEQREYLRRKVLRALRIYFAHKRWPRLAMSVIVIATGGIGALASWGLLRAGVEQMWMRYPLALFVAWAGFLGLVRLWVEVERRYFHADEDIAALLQGRDPKDTLDRLNESDWSVFDWLDFNSRIASPDDEGGCLFSILLFILGLLVLLFAWAIVTVIAGAPILIAEVFLDAFLVSALYRRMKPLDERWWITSAVQHTLRPVLATAVVLAACGYLLGATAPGARSIGEVVEHFRQGK